MASGKDIIIIGGGDDGHRSAESVSPITIKIKVASLTDAQAAQIVEAVLQITGGQVEE